MIANTSIESLDRHRASGRADAQRLRILNRLRAAPASALTRNEIAREFDMPIQSVCGRVGELKAEGLVVEDAPRLDPVTLRKVKPVRATPDLFHTLH
jgi:predicted transcriptional regulator